MKVLMTVDIPIEDYTAISELDFHANINIFPGVTTTMHHFNFENVAVKPLPLTDRELKNILNRIKHKSDAYKFGYIDGFDYYKDLIIGTKTPKR